MEYDIVYGSTYYNLILEVRKAIGKGWIPQGGVAIEVQSGLIADSDRYYQGMIRRM